VARSERCGEKTVENRLDKYANVVGYSNQLLPKIRNNAETGEKSVRIYVSRKLPESQLKPSDVIPKKIEVEGLGEVSTDVVEIGRIRKKQLLNPKERWRPSPAGVSTSRADENSAGTFGWFMVDENGSVYAISNNHVWARENLGSAGDPLVQPGRLDGGDPDKDALLTLHSFVPLSLTGENKVDLALASFDMSKIYVSILNIGGVVGKRDPAYGEAVRKDGEVDGHHRWNSHRSLGNPPSRIRLGQSLVHRRLPCPRQEQVRRQRVASADL